MNFRTLAIISMALLSGCASHTGIVAIGKETYMIAKQQGTGFPGLGNLKAEIIAEASKFCSEKNMTMQLLSTQESQPPYILGNYPRSEIQFTCQKT